MRRSASQPAEPQAVSTLLRSQLRCPKCHDLISSIHRHDFRTCECGALSLDGGRDYLRVMASDEVMALMTDDEERAKIDCSISISGEHNTASAAVALKVYKALWVASVEGTEPASAVAVRDATGFIGNRQLVPYKSVLAYLKMFCDDGGPVRQSSRGFLPTVPLHERPDA